MRKRLVLLAVASSVLAAFGALASLGPFGEPKFARNLFARLRDDLRFPVVNAVTKIASDSANNIWFSTGGGGLGSVRIAGESLDRPSTSFPINKNSFPNDYMISDDLSAVVFARFKNEEHFFFSSADIAGNAGLQWGRYTDRVDLQPPLELDGQLGVKVYDLATNGTTRLWAASHKGVYEFDLSAGETPRPTQASPYKPYNTDPENVIGGIADVSSITGKASAVFFTFPDPGISNAGKVLFYLDPAASLSPQLIGKPFTASTIGAIKVVGNQLYVAQGGEDTSQDSKKRTIVRYTFDGSAWNKTYVADFFPEVGFYTPPYRLTDIGVNPSDGTIWLATDGWAFYQAPDGLGNFSPRVCNNPSSALGTGDWTDPSDDGYAVAGDCAAAGAGWRHIIKRDNVTEGYPNNLDQSYGSVFMDAGENAWLGSNIGIRGFIARFLTLSATRYVGIDRVATVLAEDMEPGTDGFIRITVGSKTANFPAFFDATGKMTPLTFGFTFDQSADPAAVPTPSPLLFPVTSTAGGVAIKVEYFRNQADGAPMLTASATWAQIVEFQDDLMIGGPCFLETLWTGE